MKIGILGGSFNPPHLGHLFIAAQVRQILGLDQIWLMPCYQHPFHKTLAPVEHRLKMTRFLENDFIKVSEFEITQNKPSFSIDTLSVLSQQYRKTVFYWITGSDQLDNFREYKDWQKIIKDFNLVIFPREPVLPTIEEKTRQSLQLKTIPQNVIVLSSENLVLTNISSTGIRKRLAERQPITYFVPEKVEEYIKTNKLYI